ncbi:Pimeloyl-ACP methyl ester carboxylesterase [Butyrivibrio sp. ob235]|uniref:alpha/beta fold hydrolase n=1 Tax=Butyrivibrio sp. ob235 TaxID=1761780 RepID=UPI0008CF57E0|nr:alpha/beta hydrolase [Butyrivibrio sp. ob235]SEM36555.1 Pimeloyl-ACP methyl ester carboxylesterase [Butyrivibrio sp. ob235]
MKKRLKLLGKVLLVLIIVPVMSLLVIFVYNRIRMKQEESLLEKPLGQMVDVDGHMMCVYEEGEGEHTLLFLSGSGTASPILDFRSLYSLLKDEYHIVVIEKFGYGFSDVVDDERSFDTILRQDREALETAGIEGPFVLCPHSLSGLESIMWAQDYPDEVEAIIGLDMVLPRTYDEFDFDGVFKFEKLAALARKLGIVRFYYLDSSLPAALSKEEKELYRAIACRKAVNIDVINEGLSITDAVSEIDSKPKQDVPMIMFISDGKEVKGTNWVQNHYDYASDLSDAKVIELDCGHYVHNFMQDRIAEDIREFIGE